MQIAKVVPKVKTSGEGVFDYSIPPEILPMIRIGILVLVPFHGRKVDGIIIDIKKSSAIPNLKPIISVIDTTPVVDTIHIELARWMSDYYLSPFGKTLFENIVPPAKRTIRKQADIILDVQKKSPNQSTKKYLVVADFQTRLKFYLQAIEKTLSRGQQVIILVPDLTLILYFTKYLKNKIAILHAGLSHTQRWQAWDNVRRGKIDIVIGSNSALFAPVKNLGLIIVDQEENETYKSAQSPRYHAVRVAEELSRLTAARLVLGSLSPRIETYHEALKKKYLFLKPPKVPDISIVDMNFERSILSEPLKNQIVEILEKNQKALFVLNRKNTLGLATSKLEKIIKEKFPGTKIIRIEKPARHASQGDAGGDIKVFPDTRWDIAIATNFALKSNLPKINLVALIDADQDLNFPDFRSAEKTFQNLYKFLRLGDTGLIQTHLPENPVVCNLAQMDYGHFYLGEIANRQKSGFPPFTSLVLLVYRNIDEKIAKQEVQKVYDSLALIRSPLFTILGPSSPFVAQSKNFFYQQIILKFSQNLQEEVKHILIALPKGWSVDRDPYDLI